MPESCSAALLTALTKARRDLDQESVFSAASEDERLFAAAQQLRVLDIYKEEHAEIRSKRSKLDALQALAEGVSAQDVQTIFDVDGKCCTVHSTNSVLISRTLT